MAQFKIGLFAKMGLWLFGAIAFFELFELMFETPSLGYWALVLLGLGLFLIIDHPLRDQDFPQALEVGLGVVLVGIFMIHFGLVVVAPKLDADANDNEPCGLKTKEAQCYNLSHDSCLSVWDNYKKECMAEIQDSAKRPTQLIGSGVRRCTQKKISKYISFNQRKDNPDCKSYFDELKD